MHKIDRLIFNTVLKHLKTHPVVALLGPRQVGKSTLAKMILEQSPRSIYLDLERDQDRIKVESDPERYFTLHQDKLICLDEIQLLPNVFKSIRSYVDDEKHTTQFLILGSASRDLLRQSSESLAGRISYLETTPFNLIEIGNEKNFNFYDYWNKGGMPKSFLSETNEDSSVWRENYIKSFLERDIPQLGFSIPSLNIKRLWTMLAHNQGQNLNSSKLGASLGLSSHTVKKYIDILEQTYVVRSLPPYHANDKKRIIKAPKVYIRDTGLLHTLLNLETIEDVLSHPVAGASFESLVVENILTKYTRHNAFFYRDSHQNEVDLVLTKGNEKVAIEIKSSTSPKVEHGFWNALKTIKPTKKFVISQVEETFPGKDGLIYTNLSDFLKLQN